MVEYIVHDTIQFFDAIGKIKTDKTRKASIMIKNEVSHCHMLRFLNGVQLHIGGSKTNYKIYLDPKELSSNPNWKFNSTLFFHSGNNDITYSNLNFVYTIEEYDFSSDPLLDSFSIVLMEFYNSTVIFKDCVFQNNTNRTFEIIVKKQSVITFENCNFKGDFNFIFDIGSNAILN